MAVLTICGFYCTASCVAENESRDIEAGRLEIWRKWAAYPLEMILNVENTFEENVIYTDQPVLINVILKNSFAEGIFNSTTQEKAALQKAGIDLSLSSIKLCDESQQWAAFVNIYLGTNKNNVAWRGTLPASSKRRQDDNQVDANPVHAIHAFRLDLKMQPGDYFLWAEFKKDVNAPMVSDTSRNRVVCSASRLLHLRSPTNANEKAWVFAEKGAMFKRDHQYKAAEESYKKAIEIAPMLGRGPIVKGYRPFNVTWEIAGVYEATGQYQEAEQAVQETLCYVDQLPVFLRQNAAEAIENRVFRLMSKTAKKVP